MRTTTSVIIIGAGIGGLAAAALLSAHGIRVTLFERLNSAGGKMRTVPSEAGDVDAGPTVLTLRYVFDDLFESLGHRLEDHLTLIPLPCLARHFWSDGTQLDLPADQSRDIRRSREYSAGRRPPISRPSLTAPAACSTPSITR